MLLSFPIVRDLPPGLGLVPRHHMTAGKPRLFGISGRGNICLRKLFINAARAALPTLSKADMRQWMGDLLVRAKCNVAMVALAYKLARIAWATPRPGTTFVRPMDVLHDLHRRWSGCSGLLVHLRSLKATMNQNPFRVQILKSVPQVLTSDTVA